MAVISFFGDVALFRQYQVMGVDPFSCVEFPQADYRIANFEFPVPRIPKKAFYDVPDRYRVDYDFARSLNGGIFDAYSLANNHIFDYGEVGVRDTIELINNYGAKSFGVYANGPGGEFDCLEIVVNQISFCVISFVKNGRWDDEHNGPCRYDAQNIIECIKDKKKNFDHVILFPHWGTELVDIPCGVDIDNSRLFIDSGASAVIGHHPHIPQGIEKYKNGIIAYSLGSFIYTPENEIGFTKKPIERNYSICFSVEFDVDHIVNNDVLFYDYDNLKKIPIATTGRQYERYFKLLNVNICNEKMYKKKVRSVLIFRELVSFWERFRSSPWDTTLNYAKYIKFEHIRKILPF